MAQTVCFVYQGMGMHVFIAVPFVSIVRGSLGLGFSWATACHYGVYIAMAGSGQIHKQYDTQILYYRLQRLWTLNSTSPLLVVLQTLNTTPEPNYACCAAVASAAWWFIATVYMAFGLPVVFHPTKLPTPLFPWWPSATVLTTIFLIGERRRC
jgi:hypothetical protein